VKKIIIVVGLSVFVMPFSRAAELGRLFFSPAQRAQLEARAQPISDSKKVSLNGIVQKTGGERTIWINGKAHIVSEHDPHSLARIELPIPDKAGTQSLAVEQKIIFQRSP
jgi:hypothetical protein